MQRASVLAFDDIVSGNVYTPEHYNKILGEHDQLNIEAVVDQATTASGATLTVAIEHSGDGRNWLQKNLPAEIDASALGAGPGTTVLTGFDANTKPSLGFVRLKVSVRGTTGQAKLKLHVTARDRGAGRPIREHVEVPVGAIAVAPVLGREEADATPSAERAMETAGNGHEHARTDCACGGSCARNRINGRRAAVDEWEAG